MNKVIEEDVKEIISVIGNKIDILENKNVLITGASGMLAGYLIHALIYANKFLLQNPAKLYLITRNKGNVFGKEKNVYLINADIAKKIPNVPFPDFIVHAASKAAPKIYINNKIDTLNTNILGLYNLLGLVTKKLQSFLYLSSGEVYGNPPSEEKINEEYVGRVDNLNEKSCYAEGKRAGETICMNYFWERGLPVKIARIFHTFGPGLNLDDGRIFSDFIKNGLEKKNISIEGTRTIERSFLYLKDATIMFLFLLLSDRNGKVYNIANDKNIVSVEKFANIVCNEFNNCYQKKLLVKIIKNRKNAYYSHAIRSQMPDISKFMEEFGYNPRTSVKEAVSRTIAYYLGK